MKKLIIALAVMASFGAQANRCDYPDQIAKDGSLCGARAASVRPGGYTPPSEYSAPVQSSEDQEIQKNIEDERIEHWREQNKALNSVKDSVVNTGMQKWLCPTVRRTYYTVEGDLNTKNQYMVVEGHVWYRMPNEYGNIEYTNTTYSDFSFFPMDVNGGIALINTGDIGNAEPEPKACFKFTGKAPAMAPANHIDFLVLNTWLKK
ncbi:hypothetical protein SB5531_01239 [Klebsiella variicola]|uniref:hypothetical protein n=1 Tax=Klebsiella variicola TaxID=244366 RepID=UPI0010E41FFD|nr:hypothetical protein [Klebsiella variicola]VGP76165.1 hypothetical protein SB5531_01239 [Klebsiella variicola]